ncbi:hypothetical protein F4820DRAFT_406613 [Hypoxylon rubiginosum]|uniref:Uncharacterized protein n=1 Tax=Hypoxylon rubiginosum TaxID=110542 RepID=A0ACB9ZDZ3_9PEZI|nr:hypothetical protein F4820DRAFT_406613 [Hypoxylon rubiginosum]
MDSPKPGVDLEKELTCSICTDILYQPLTLLDCLHTFCGSCLKDWFGYQKLIAETSPNPPTIGSQIFTCPSCRAPVRDTRHNATVTTLLDMFLAANPDKAKPEDEKEEMRKKYKPGDDVLPQIRTPQKSPEERRLDEMERQMLEQARQLSLQEAGVSLEPAEGSRNRARRHHESSRSEDRRGRSDRDSSRETRHRDARDRSQRDEEYRYRSDSGNTLQPDVLSDERRRHRSESHHRSRDSSRTRRRRVEHQASIRSLISSSDVDSRDLEREIEEFARQIQEEGLLDGLDLDNIDLTQNDDLSQKITEAYRRRQRERIRAQQQQQQPRRSDPSFTSSRPEQVQPLLRPLPAGISRPNSRPRSSSANSRPASSTNQSQADDRSRPPITSTHLEVRAEPDRRRRRRESSGARSVTEPVRPRTADTRPAAKSQTDLTQRSHSSEPSSRPSISESRSASMPTSNSVAQTPSTDSTRPRDLSFSERASAAQIPPAPSPETHSDDSSSGRPKRARRPSSTIVAQPPLPSLGLLSSPTHQTHHQRTLSQYYYEPSITCSRCKRQHIEYEVHYNCSKCAHGDWNICLDCYRSARGCEHWFGFGYAALKNWEKARAAGKEGLEPPHTLTACRYRPPKYTPGGAEGRRTLTTDNPDNRLESGMFCARCFTWTNECFWRCESCNEGDWGFCNNCVNQGKCCTHALLPLAYVAPATSPHTPPGSPRLPRRPRGATLYSGPNAVSLGNFKSLTFTTTCEVCRDAILPTYGRYHCYECTSSVSQDAQAGYYEVCADCYASLVHKKRISDENGHRGWRRCLKGHRMAIVGFTEGSLGLRRCTLHETIGGRTLRTGPYEGLPAVVPGAEGLRLQKWSWKGASGSELVERLVTVDVSATAPAPATSADYFPPAGGAGLRAAARWSWYPQAGTTDELPFPKGAEVREIEDVNGEWWFGCYMGAEGLFPAPYVRVID